jgi:hypothetical protein
MGYSQHFQSASPEQFIFYAYEAISPPMTKSMYVKEVVYDLLTLK